ncbi:MAG: nucleotidyltransferase family protein [Candidatus Methylacidiphilales bacterium]
MTPRDRGLTPGSSNNNNNNNNRGRGTNSTNTNSSAHQRIQKMLERLHRTTPAPPPYAGLLPAEDIEKAMEAARKAAEILRRHGAARVLLFGSLARARAFTVDSDINLAADGIPAEHYFQACNAAIEIYKAHTIHVIDLQSITESYRASVLAQGKII